MARLLLDHGADPDAGYLWDGNHPFTALTGALGGGENKGNQPPHRHALALARLLLEAGADPNDSQALYNRHPTRKEHPGKFGRAPMSSPPTDRPKSRQSSNLNEGACRAQA